MERIRILQLFLFSFLYLLESYISLISFSEEGSENLGAGTIVVCSTWILSWPVYVCMWQVK
ncbi:hypothetical protein V8F33_001241 [Rhypophila sp. PSN 637]